ncbi:MAG TPA: type I-C CRISPR-associated protein Cas5c [Pirellulales bacterium]|nr:type I-C CRISPR-associated protein Cas5c [Pirellulales bacterium]
MPSSVFVKVWGEYACFTRPELKVERLSYPIMTPSAARGVLDAILWKPQMIWHVRSITALVRWWLPDGASRRPYEFLGVRRNEIQDKIAPRTVSGWMAEPETCEPYLTDSAGRESVQGQHRTQRNTLALRDVAYVIEATPLLTKKANQPRAKPEDIDEPAGPDSVAKYVAMFQRRVERGQCFHRPYLGCREFACNFAPVDGSEQPVDWNESLGLMLYDIQFGEANTPAFFHAEVRLGVLHCDTLAPGRSGEPPIKVHGWAQTAESEVPA